MSLNIATNVSFEDENKVDTVDSKANDNDIANAVETTAVIISGHVEQDSTDDVVLVPLTAKFEYIWDLISHAEICFRPSE
ncbi:hypothetical protein MAM1_0185c07505 [Mucor ambiguus]|uniref:Uncharacterized protein n=1 Tax=Mucor ambiguus TaxID=91626 RepID=A0A0C9LW68_9FUNG|nr:hypothetical protein MAM1_0185c07505 [Mucor ambiguus]